MLAGTDIHKIIDHNNYFYYPLNSFGTKIEVLCYGAAFFCVCTLNFLKN